MRNPLRYFVFAFCSAAALQADFNYGIGTSESSPTYFGQNYYVGVGADENEFNSSCAVTVTRDGAYFASASSDGALNTAWETSGAGNFSADFSSGNGDNGSASVNMDVIADPTPTPVNLTASNLTPTSFTLSWQIVPADPGVNYEVSRGGVSLGLASGLSRSITGLQQGQTYVMRVRSSNIYEELSDWSSPLSVTLTDTTAPTAPVLQSPAHTASTVTLSWSAASDAGGVAGYDVYLSKSGTVVLVGQTSGTVTTFTHSRFPSTTYDYFVKARDGFGNVSQSNTVTSTTPASSDSDSDGIPNQLEALFGNANPAVDSTLNLKTHRPNE